MSAGQADGRPDVSTMAVVHQYYRREFELAPRIVRDIAPGERERQERAAAWFATTAAMMHHHHVVEDEMMFPLLVGRAPQLLLDRMEVQHRRLAEALDRVEPRLAAWHHEDPASATALAESLDAVYPVLVEHLDAEEIEVMPLVARYLTVEEYGRQGTSGNAMSPHTLMMAFGAMVEQASPEAAAVMLSHPPAHVREAWHEHGFAEYRALMHLLRGGLVPIGRPAASRALQYTDSS